MLLYLVNVFLEKVLYVKKISQIVQRVYIIRIQNVIISNKKCYQFVNNRFFTRLVYIYMVIFTYCQK